MIPDTVPWVDRYADAAPQLCALRWSYWFGSPIDNIKLYSTKLFAC